MLRRSARALVALLAVWSIAGAEVAYAAYPNTAGGALHDCGAGHDPLVGHYSVAVLHKALRELNTNSLQYTTCADALQNAINSQLSRPRTHRGGKVTLPGQGGPVAPSVVKQRVSHVKKLGGAPFLLPSGQTVTPGAVTVHSASFLSSLPTPLLIVLAALLAAVVAVGGRALHQLVRTRRSH